MRLSTRLTDVAGLPGHRRLRDHPGAGAHVPGHRARTFRVGKRILELNPDHPLVTGLRQAHKDRTRRSPPVAETAELLYGTALLAEGGALEDPARFAELLADRLARTGVGVVSTKISSGLKAGRRG